MTISCRKCKRSFDGSKTRVAGFCPRCVQGPAPLEGQARAKSPIGGVLATLLILAGAVVGLRILQKNRTSPPRPATPVALSPVAERLSALRSAQSEEDRIRALDELQAAPGFASNAEARRVFLAGVHEVVVQPLDRRIRSQFGKSQPPRRLSDLLYVYRMLAGETVDGPELARILGDSLWPEEARGLMDPYLKRFAEAPRIERDESAVKRALGALTSEPWVERSLAEIREGAKRFPDAAFAPGLFTQEALDGYVRAEVRTQAAALERLHARWGVSRSSSSFESALLASYKKEHAAHWTRVFEAAAIPPFSDSEDALGRIPDLVPLFEAVYRERPLTIDGRKVLAPSDSGAWIATAGAAMRSLRDALKRFADAASRGRRFLAGTEALDALAIAMADARTAVHRAPASADPAVRKWAQALLLAVVEKTREALRSEARVELNAAWSAHKSPADLYPLRRDAPSDMSLEDFTAWFGPGGRVSELESAAWTLSRYRLDGEPVIRISEPFRAAAQVVNGYPNRTRFSRSFQGVLWQSGKIVVKGTLKIESGHEFISEAKLTIGAQELDLTPHPDRTSHVASFEWSPGDAVRFDLAVVDGSELRTLTLYRSGEKETWAWFRLLDALAIRAESSTRYALTASAGERHATILLTAPATNPFVPGFFQAFRFPETVAD